MDVPTVSYRAIWLCGYIKDISMVRLAAWSGVVSARACSLAHDRCLRGNLWLLFEKVVIVRSRFDDAVCCRGCIKQMKVTKGR